MASRNTIGFKTFTATAVALEPYVRVILDGDGLISVAGTGDYAIGMTQEYIPASGSGIVKLINSPGSHWCQAASAVHVGDIGYTAAVGEIDDATGGTSILRRQISEDATAQGDVIQSIQVDKGALTSTVFASTDVGTVAASNSAQNDGTAITNRITYVTASNGTKAVVLPTCVAGLLYIIHNTVAGQTLKVFPGASDVIIPLGANNVQTLVASSTAIYFGLGAVNWACIQLAAPV